jgi:hypothetical protein
MGTRYLHTEASADIYKRGAMLAPFMFTPSSRLSTLSCSSDITKHTENMFKGIPFLLHFCDNLAFCRIFQQTIFTIKRFWWYFKVRIRIRSYFEKFDQDPATKMVRITLLPRSDALYSMKDGLGNNRIHHSPALYCNNPPLVGIADPDRGKKAYSWPHWSQISFFFLTNYYRLFS